MTAAKPKVINLQDYFKLHKAITNEEIEVLLRNERTNVRNLDSLVTDLLSETHTLKTAELLKRKAIIVGHNLMLISDWLEDKIEEEKSEEGKKAKQDSQKLYRLLFKN